MDVLNPSEMLLDCARWPRLMDALSALDEWSFLRPTLTKSPAAIRALMHAPVTLATWIATFKPELKARPVLRVLVPGAFLQDGMHDGIWYHAIPALLGAPQMCIEVTLTRNERYPATKEPSEAHKLAREGAKTLRAARILEGTLIDALAEDTAYDLVVLFQPGFENAGPPQYRYSWFQDKELGALLHREIPVAVTAYEVMEYEHERWLLDPFGIRAMSRVVQNRYGRNERPSGKKGPPLYWGTVLWQIDPASRLKIPLPKNHPVAREAAFIEKAPMHWRTRPDDVDLWALGMKVSAETAFSKRKKEVLLLPDDVAVDAATGYVYTITVERHLKSVAGGSTFIPEEVLKSWPAQPQFGFERFLWALHAYRKLVDSVDDIEELAPAGAEFWQYGICSERSMERGGKFIDMLEAQRVAMKDDGTEASRYEAFGVLAQITHYYLKDIKQPDGIIPLLRSAIANNLFPAAVSQVALTMLERGEPWSPYGRELLDLLAKAGDFGAMFNLAMAFSFGHGGEKDEDHSCGLLEAIATNEEAGHGIRGVATAILGQRYSGDDAVQPDWEKAQPWYELGALMGNGGCSFALGLHWDDGPHREDFSMEPADPPRALRYYRAGMAEGDMQCTTNLALLLSRYPDEAEDGIESTELLHKAADAGDPIAKAAIDQGNRSRRKAS
jgi:hypothetical protein